MDVWSDKKRQNQERTHPRNDESSAGVQKDNGEKTEMVWARHEDGGRSRSEESDDESDTGERKRRRPKTGWKDVCKRDMQTVGLIIIILVLPPGVVSIKLCPPNAWHSRWRCR